MDVSTIVQILDITGWVINGKDNVSVVIKMSTFSDMELKILVKMEREVF